ncbi:hypothetical protein NDU88_004393 [Pleurodeles waltl]|uniref:Uncharacterized protein n=1 Tax=Pleurodeles waltl TaxID=8319 RepID=A0AAV7VG54_PLEWA|nr:hypothetical protein NDU88_004393 [Pleurodeles waltl]
MALSGNFMSSDTTAPMIPNGNLQLKEKHIYQLFSLAGDHANKAANKNKANSLGQDLMLPGDERGMRVGLGAAIIASSGVDNYGLASVQGATFDGNKLERDPIFFTFNFSSASEAMKNPPVISLQVALGFPVYCNVYHRLQKVFAPPLP